MQAGYPQKQAVAIALNNAANTDPVIAKWKDLVNMPTRDLEAFVKSPWGKQAGLSPSKAASLGIKSGRESARWILKMRKVRTANWTPSMYDWAKRQVSFISRMRGSRGALYKGEAPTRKLLSLLIWGHDPERYESGLRGALMGSVMKR
jgi:hypothetical protein